MSQTASAIRNNYISSYIHVTKEWSNYVWTVFLSVTTLVLCQLGPIGGLIHRATHRYKSLMVFGTVLKFIGNAIILIPASNSTQSTVALTFSQILLGFGSSQPIGARAGSQASIPHEDVSSAIAIVSLWSTLGSSVGYTIAATIWTDQMLSYMREEMPDVPEKTINTIYGSIKVLRTKYSWSDPIRQGAVRAYARTNGIIFVTAAVINIVLIICALLMPNFYLGKQQNAVTNTDVSGQPVEFHRRVDEDEAKEGYWSKVKNLYYKEY